MGKIGDEQAYPIQATGERPCLVETYGLTKRELICAMALQGVMASDCEGLQPKNHAQYAVACADALLAALEPNPAPDNRDELLAALRELRDATERGGYDAVTAAIRNANTAITHAEGRMTKREEYERID